MEDFDPNYDGLGVFRRLLAGAAILFFVGLVVVIPLWIQAAQGDPPGPATITRPEDAEVLVECPAGTYRFVHPEYLFSTIIAEPPATFAEICRDEMEPWPVACWVCSIYDEEAEDQLYHRLCCLYSDDSMRLELP